MTTIVPFKMVSITSPDPVEAGGLMIQNNFKTIANYLETISGNVDNRVDGITPTITIGSVVTLDSSASAYVTNTGDLTAAIFNFGIPKGTDGSSGNISGVDLSAYTTLATTKATSAELQVEINLVNSAVQNITSNYLNKNNNLSDLQNTNISRVNINKGQVELFADGSLNVETNCISGNVFFLRLDGDYTLTDPLNKGAGSTYLWRVVQSITGGNTLSFNTNFKWAGGTPPTITTAASAVDVISAISDGVYLYSAFIQDLK